MKYLFIFLMPISALAIDNLNYFDLELDHQKDGVHISVAAKPLFPYEYLRDNRYLLRDVSYDHIFDGPFRQVAFLMRTLERNRGVLLAKNSEEGLPILKFRFWLNIREESGLIIQPTEYNVLLELSPEANTCAISCAEWGTRKTFAINELNQLEPYKEFIEYLVLPTQDKVLHRPGTSSFVVDLFYRWPDVVLDQDEVNLFDLFPSFLLWDKGIANRLRKFVASAYSYNQDGQWHSATSNHTRLFKHSIEAFTKVLEAEEESPESYIVALEEYLHKVPSDRRALQRLMEAYLEQEKDIEAYGLISRYQPFFATIREGLDNQEALAKRAEQKRNFLLGKLAQFDRISDATVAITSPADGDLVTGTTRLDFSVANSNADLLLVDAYLGDQRIARVEDPPFSLPFSVEDLGKRQANLRIVAYFEDETYQEDRIRVKVLEVDQEEKVNLVPLRASLIDLKDSGETAAKENFIITENGQKKEVAHYRYSEAPLRVAFVLDTSASMLGDKILATQFAVNSFISKLKPDDRASVYTFDDRVLKISDFTNDFTDLKPNLMTLLPKGATSLYDAMLIAHDALLGENGTKVLIIMSDGDDMGSSTTDIHVASTFRHSPVMVYSVILTGGDFDIPRAAKQFLKQIARMTGSTHTQVRNPNNLPDTFDKIYQDLRSYYYLDYYSDIADPNKRKIEVRYKGRGRLRYRVLN